MLSICTEHEKMLSNIIETAKPYLDENSNLESLVVGLSGGIDSALTAAIASEVVKQTQNVKLIGRCIPIDTSSRPEIERAEAVGRAFCDDFETRDLTAAYRDLYSSLVSGSGRESDDTNAEKIRRGNVKARVRMVYLFDLAHLNRGMVLSTDNYTELLLGFWTLHGDVGNYGFLQYLWKTEVYGLARHLVGEYSKSGDADKAEALKACIDAVPTDGLGITSSDFEQIGVDDYETADRMLIDYLRGNRENESHPLIQRHLTSEFKRLDPQNIPREVVLGGLRET